MSAGRILVVDDDPQIRRVMRVALTGHSYEVDDVKNGEAALEKLRDRRFDLVLLNMNMPGMGGLETCRAIRGASERAVIMLTVRDTESGKVEALDAGADDYVTKPFNPPELLACIRAALRRTPSTHGPSGRLTLGSIEVDFDIRQVNARSWHVRLTPKEFELLRPVALRTAAGRLGSRLRRPSRLSAALCEPNYARRSRRSPPTRCVC
jgi:two-component system KDP operon response regulator KdpE